jgi:hypothetical protein
VAVFKLEAKRYVMCQLNFCCSLLTVSSAKIYLQGFCFGFVEFEDASAVQCAIEVNI